ncbi:carbon storage regulator [Caulifigura coniformis]|uniref:Carbon storage regulator n=1 Tax=Caulifigura coniformis TaxID=2527983 RepID=A0A517SEP4_9PLAN|nr:carbon storage regulator [Caulifigura coniformis]QDT54612.1 carbon storage regulator [Caulifigura coniformis]
MLTLTRKPGERIILDGGITIVIGEIRGQKVKVSIDAPKGQRIAREERWGLGPASPDATETRAAS